METAKRESILRAATRAFERYGFKKASVDEIAKQAGVGKGTVYLAYDTKEDLFYQAVLRELRAWIAEVAKLRDPRVPADELFLRSSVAAFHYLEERPLVRDLIFGNCALMLPEWADRLEELRAVGRETPLEILRLGVRQGIFRKDIDLEEVATVIQDFDIATYVFHARSKAVRSKETRQAIEEQLVKRLRTGLDLLMNGLRRRK